MEGEEYIIVGDTDEYKECLVMVGFRSKESTEKKIKQMLEDPTDNDKKLIEGHTNLRAKKVVSKDCWWNDPFLAN